jgi:lysophospholipase L1-like esterase
MSPVHFEFREKILPSNHRAFSLRTCLRSFCAIVLLSAGTANILRGGDAQTHWVASWATSQQRMELSDSLPSADLTDATLRQIVHLSLGGSRVRLRLSNRFGNSPLHLTAVHLARAVSPLSEKIVSATDKALAFSGALDVTIPAHADYLSDPISFAVSDLSDLAITMHIDKAPEEQTGHAGSRATSYLTHGDAVAALEFATPKKVEHWYFSAGVDVATAPEASAIVILGDSITDGHGATTDGNNRWPDILAQRLQSQPASRNLAVDNQGIGGNRLLLDGAGPNALSRIDQDVLAQPGVRYLIVLEGVNDIGMLGRQGEVTAAEHELLVHQLIGAYEQIIARAHSQNITVIGATIMPFVGSEFYHPSPTTDADRLAVNAWIRTPGHFDALLDFDKVMRDPEHPDRLLPAFDSGDHLHPSPAGYAAMAQSVPLSLFARAPEPASNSMYLRDGSQPAVAPQAGAKQSGTSLKF